MKWIAHATSAILTIAIISGCSQEPPASASSPVPVYAPASAEIEVGSSSMPGGRKDSPSSTAERTSTEMYCETMTISFFEYALKSKPPSSEEQAQRIRAAEKQMLDTCMSMPLVGGKEKLLKDLTPAELEQLGCLAIVDGISTAHYSASGDQLLYSELSQRRQFFMDACASNSKQLLSDMKQYGPYHVLKKNY